MKIVMINTLYAPYRVGGAERSTQFLAEGLSEAGHEVVVACTKPNPGTRTETVGSVRVKYIGLKNVYWQFREEEKRGWLKPVWHALDSFNPLMQDEVENLLSEEDPEVVHTHNLSGFSVSAWRAARRVSVPVVHTIRDYRLLCPRNMYRNSENCHSQCMRCRPFAAPRRWLSRDLRAVVGISQFVLQRHREHGYFEGVDLETVIHNAFRIQEERGPEPQATDTGGPLQIGFLGRVSEMKGIEHLLEVVSRFDPESVGLRVGGRGSKDYVRKLRRAYDGRQIEFCGFVDSARFLPELDVLVVPSVWHEPFGRVVIEAYAHGIPVVAARRGGLPEIVVNGETGWTFDPSDDEALYERIRSLRDDPELLSGLSARVRETARCFSLDRHVKAYVQVYEKAVGG